MLFFEQKFPARKGVQRMMDPLVLMQSDKSWQVTDK